MIRITLDEADVARLEDLQQMTTTATGFNYSLGKIIQGVVCSREIKLEMDNMSGQQVIEIGIDDITLDDVVAGLDLERNPPGKQSMSRQTSDGPQADAWVQKEIDKHNRNTN